jgi:hypothetical protein
MLCCEYDDVAQILPITFLLQYLLHIYFGVTAQGGRLLFHSIGIHMRGCYEVIGMLVSQEWCCLQKFHYA